ncbi:hypothetical protein LPJ53_000939 [Coemansia erecta]|uniref:Uncharacterized protein n=1 Tax=Coemansia erecta TaxID=147472 RepID=A0A9W7Y5Z3_9FUNG|nr:hypothetical protein LPJ53_000939 [Coemansia erecta]
MNSTGSSSSTSSVYSTSPSILHQETNSSSPKSPVNQRAQMCRQGESARPYMCKCSQCDPNFYTIPLNDLIKGNVEYVCRDCQMSTMYYREVQQHESTSGHRRWYNYPQ